MSRSKKCFMDSPDIPGKELSPEKQKMGLMRKIFPAGLNFRIMRKIYQTGIFKAIFIAVFTLFFTAKSFADYTVPAGQTIDAGTITGQSGVLIINGTLKVSSNISLLGFT